MNIYKICIFNLIIAKIQSFKIRKKVVDLGIDFVQMTSSAFQHLQSLVGVK